MSQKTLRVSLFNYLLIFIITIPFYCTLPEDPAQNPQNVEITFITGSDGDTVSIGDSISFRLAVLYPYLVDSVVIHSGDSVLLTLRNISDTLNVSLFSSLPGKHPFTITGYCQRNVTTSTISSIFVKSLPIVVDRQPGNITAINAASALFTVKASGNPLPSVQWYRDSIPLTGETHDTLKIDTVSTLMNGSRFRALLTNSTDTLWSSAAILTVLDNISRFDTVRWDSSVWW
jgi:hypothetical protein